MRYKSRFPAHVSPFRCSVEDKAELDRLSRESGLSIGTLLRYAIRVALRGKTVEQIMRGWEPDVEGAAPWKERNHG